MLLLIEEMVSAQSSLVWLTISKALVRSLVLCGVGGRGRLKPRAILCVRGRRVDTVEWLGSKPYWLGERGSELLKFCLQKAF